jgi:hypothetical protein
MTVEQIVREVEALPDAEKAQLMDVLKTRVYGAEDSEILQAQVALAEERLAAYERGEDTAEDAEVVIERIRQKIRGIGH